MGQVLEEQVFLEWTHLSCAFRVWDCGFRTWHASPAGMGLSPGALPRRRRSPDTLGLAVRGSAEFRPLHRLRPEHRAVLGGSSSALLGFADYSQIGIMGLRYKFVNFGAGKSPGPPNWRAQKDRYRARGCPPPSRHDCGAASVKGRTRFPVSTAGHSQAHVCCPRDCAE